MNKKKDILLLFVLSIFVPSTSFAVSDNYAYFGAKVGYNIMSGDCFENYTECEDDSVGYGIFAGYQFNSWFGAEIDAIDYGNYKGFYHSSRNEDDIRGYAASLKFSQPVLDNTEVYMRIGGAYMNINRPLNSDSGLSPVGAIGVAYKLTPNWILRPEYQYLADIGDRSGHFVSLGLSYRFNQISKKPGSVYIDSSQIQPEPKVEEPVVEKKEVVFVLIERDPTEKDKEVFTSEPVLFAVNSSILDRKARAELKRVVKFLEDKPNAKVWIQGYTDNTGAAKYNQWLSKRRAQSAGEYFHNLGIKNIYMKGKGVASTASKSANANDRKVVISVTQDNEILADF